MLYILLIIDLQYNWYSRFEQKSGMLFRQLVVVSVRPGQIRTGVHRQKSVHARCLRICCAGPQRSDVDVGKRMGRL